MASTSSTSPGFGQTSSIDAMNQLCRVCGAHAAGFHFGAFTCEGCKSFFGRTCNNLGSISKCINNWECVVHKTNRTSCKACRLRKCLLVGMSKSASRYGRRSKWFKIHCTHEDQERGSGNSNVKRGGAGSNCCENLWRNLGLISMPFSQPGLEASQHVFPFLTSVSSEGATLPSPLAQNPILPIYLPQSSFSLHHHPQPPSQLDRLRSPLSAPEIPIDLTKKSLWVSSWSLTSARPQTSNSPPGSSLLRSTPVLITNPDDEDDRQPPRENTYSRMPLDLTLIRS